MNNNWKIHSALAMSMRARGCLIVAVLLIAGCAHPVFKLQPLAGNQPAPYPIWSGGPSELMEDDYFEKANLRRRFYYETAKEDTSPNQGPDYSDGIGLALSGGGSKSASYAMGVLEALYANEVLQHEVKIISTVSGGGYAAYWYYARLTDTYLENPRFLAASNPKLSRKERFLQDIPSFFSECLPFRYSGLLHLSSDIDQEGLEQSREPCSATDDRWVMEGDPWRFQNHLRGYADVLSNDFELGFGRKGIVTDVMKTLGLTAATFPIHLVSNIVFDWRLPISPSQRQYERGIERTYGLAPVDLSNGCGDDILSDKIDGCEYVRPSPNRLVGRGLTFATLQLARKRQQRDWDDRKITEDKSIAPRIPLFVVNTTAGVSRTPFDLLEQRLPDFEDSVFEFTPAAFGSRLYGRWPGSHPDMDVVAATSASAAFFDSQQRTMSWPSRALVGSLFRLFQLEWGKDIANPSQPDRLRGAHQAFPFPFYFFHHDAKNPHAPYIHLSDGGQSDNTGIFSLIRRGVRTIIFADAGEDRKGVFKDLCTLRRQLSRKGLYLYIPSLNNAESSFAMECDSARVDRKAQARPHSIWQMASPIVEACVTRDASDVACSKESGAKFFSRIYILKPSLDFDKLREPIKDCQKAAMLDDSDSLKSPACINGYVAAARAQPGLPREVYGFLVRDWSANSTSHPIFPQHSTWKMTLNSSSALFGAYKALGRWDTQRLLVDNRALCRGDRNMKLNDAAERDRVKLPIDRVCPTRDDGMEE